MFLVLMMDNAGFISTAVVTLIEPWYRGSRIEPLKAPFLGGFGFQIPALGPIILKPSPLGTR